MECRSLLLALLILLFSSFTIGFYLVTDYFMDPKFPKIFGQICGKSVQDDCLWLNSHLNTFGLANYGANRDCITTLDAGDHPGSLYKVVWKRFKIESGDCSKDYIELYDTRMDSINSSTNLIGRFCGRSYPNITGYPTQQYLTVKWHTDGSREDKGFRILATRNLPYPCSDDYYHCKSENRCIDGRLKCDGIKQCDNGEDESSCSGWEKFIGGFLALGTAGIVGVVGAVLFGCILIGVTVSAFTCCRKPCSRCWGKICKPCCREGKTVDVKADPVEENLACSAVDVREEKAIADRSEVSTPLSPVKVVSVTPVPLGAQSLTGQCVTINEPPVPASPTTGVKEATAGLQNLTTTTDVTKVDS